MNGSTAVQSDAGSEGDEGISLSAAVPSSESLARTLPENARDQFRGAVQSAAMEITPHVDDEEVVFVVVHRRGSNDNVPEDDDVVYRVRGRIDDEDVILHRCTCPHHRYRRERGEYCKHMSAVRIRLDGE